MEHTDPGDTSGPSDRRRFLRAGLTGAALAAIPVLGRSGAASAQGQPDPDAGTTTTAPPARPTTDDVATLRFMQTLELATRDLYDIALVEGSFDEEAVQVLEVFREHHEAYAQEFNGLLGRVGALFPNQALFDEYRSRFAAGDEEVALAAAELENALVATYTDALGSLEGVEGAALVASILTTEARHGQVMALAAGVDAPKELLDPQAEPLRLADYPPTLPSE